MKLIKDTKSYNSEGKTSSSTTTTIVEGWKEALCMLTFIGTAFIQQCKGNSWDDVVGNATYMSNQVKKRFGCEK